VRSLALVPHAIGLVRSGGLRGAGWWLRAAVASGRALLRRDFRGQEVDHLYAPWLLHAGLSPDQAGGGLMMPLFAGTLRSFGLPVVAGGAGRFAAESLANLLAVHLIRIASAPRSLARRADGVLLQGKLRAVVEYVEEQLDAGLTLERMAAAAHLSVYHFAPQFKAATGLPPHQYVILRRVERAQQLLQGGRDLSLAEVAAPAGFSDQSQFSHHFKRVVGITPGQFRTPARIA
jgi:AraC-like DNA-binding protein